MRAGAHVHLWTTSITGAEFANAVFESEYDGAVKFLAVAKEVTKYTADQSQLNIETVIESLSRGRGMYAGAPGFVVVLSKCDGNCVSPAWN